MPRTSLTTLRAGGFAAIPAVLVAPLMPRAPMLSLVPLLLFLLLLAPIPAGAQAGAALAPATRTGDEAPGLAKPSRFTFWLGGGYGRGRAIQFHGVEEAFTLNVSAQRGPLLLTVRTAGVSSSIVDWSADVGLLVGLASSPARPFHVGAGVGLGYGYTSSPDTYHGLGLLTVLAELQLAWRFTGYAGLGLYGFASLNGTDRFGGATVAFQLGRLR